MTVPTIGFEPDTILSKPEIAISQLNEAISMFVQLRFLPAITLAGAAEEILGKLLIRQGVPHVISESVSAIERLRDQTGLHVMADSSGREIIDSWNHARNAAKHLIGPETESITLNLCDEAYWLIRRAIANADKLGLSVAGSQDFENWVLANVNM